MASEAEIEAGREAVATIFAGCNRPCGKDRSKCDCVQVAIAVLAAAERVREDAADQMREGLAKIDQWSRAYPLKVFPEPDFKKAHQLLKAGGMTIDAISASAMRHVVEGVGKIARAALPPPPGGT